MGQGWQKRSWGRRGQSGVGRRVETGSLVDGWGTQVSMAAGCVMVPAGDTRVAAWIQTPAPFCTRFGHLTILSPQGLFALLVGTRGTIIVLSHRAVVRFQQENEKE